MRLLADGNIHSGESLGESLGISRAAIWKQLQQLQDLGVPLTSVKGLGYCVEGGLDLLDYNIMLENFYAMYSKANPFEGKKILSELQVETSVDSTSQNLLRLSARGNSIHGVACFAEKQTAGRGRRGRSWQSPFASNLYFSIGWRIQNGVAAVEGLSLAVGVALCEALQSFGLDEVQLKWPNDLLYRGKKLGGILLEISGDAAGECNLVLGVGVNVSMPQQAAEEIDQAWVDLASIAKEQGLAVLPSRNELAARMLVHLFALLESYESLGFPHWRKRWEQLDAYAGQQVRLQLGAKEVTGEVQGVNDAGALLLKTHEGLQTFIGGEISLRPLL